MKKNILLLHGAIGAKDQLQTLSELLSVDFNTHAINFSGHGGEKATDNFSIASFANEIRQYIQEHQLEKPHIFGYSMGGYVAMYLALQEPTLIASIVTLATKFHWDAATATRELKMMDANVIEEKLPDFAMQLARRHAPHDWKMLLEKTKKLLIAISENNPLKKEDFSNIHTPCLLMLGDRDKMICVDETLSIYRMLPNGQMAVLPGTPHPIEHVSMPQLHFQITSFLKRT